MTATGAKRTSPVDAVAKAEDELATKRQELQEAVASGDVERVLTLRTFTEVNGPRAVTAALLAQLEAEIDELQTASDSGELQRREDEAEASFQAARSTYEQAGKALAEAQRIGDQAAKTLAAASRERITAVRRLHDLRKKREQLAERSEAEITARIRAIAGLEPEVDEQAPRAPRRQRATGQFEPREAFILSGSDPR